MFVLTVANDARRSFSQIEIS